tara:strand:- start:43 stop:291 length:249 start_codon:yes stop_codon:yes gene_type:complete
MTNTVGCVIAAQQRGPTKWKSFEDVFPWFESLSLISLTILIQSLILPFQQTTVQQWQDEQGGGRQEGSGICMHLCSVRKFLH